MTIVQVTVWTLLVFDLAASLYLLGLAVASVFPARRLTLSTAHLPFLAVVIPAHNEEALLQELLDSLTAQTYPKDRFSVHLVADNCSDLTAAIGHTNGITVHERHDPNRPGKGQALGWLLARLRHETQIDAFVFIDGDSTIDADFLTVMSTRVRTEKCALQASYRVKDASSHALVGLRALAFAIMHDLRGRGKARLGLSCGLWGNGMILSRDIVGLIPWQDLSAVEDAEQHLLLLMQGIKVQFVGDTHVYGHMPSTFSASRDQQRRWEGGKLHLVRHYALRLVIHAVRVRDLAIGVASWELLLPPLSVHILLAVGLNLIAYPTLGITGVAVATIALTAVSAYVSCGLVTARLPLRVYISLIYAPAYIAWKAWLFVCELPRRTGPAWMKTSRDPS